MGQAKGRRGFSALIAITPCKPEPIRLRRQDDEGTSSKYLSIRELLAIRFGAESLEQVLSCLRRRCDGEVRQLPAGLRNGFLVVLAEEGPKNRQISHQRPTSILFPSSQRTQVASVWSAERHRVVLRQSSIRNTQPLLLSSPSLFPWNSQQPPKSQSA